MAWRPGGGHSGAETAEFSPSQGEAEERAHLTEEAGVFGRELREPHGAAVGGDHAKVEQVAQKPAKEAAEGVAMSAGVALAGDRGGYSRAKDELGRKGVPVAGPG